MDQRQRAYVWEFPVRLTHWINVLCILALSITGFYIGSPYMHAYSTDQYIMGTVRVVHFIAAYAFLMSLIMRVYWAFAGNKYASWRTMLPFTKRQRADMKSALKFDFLASNKPPYAAGHTAVAGFAYFIVFLLFFFEASSGFALYGLSHPKGALWAVLGGWMFGLMGIQTVRLYHHLVMYALLAFAIIHVYIAWWYDTVERNGLMGGIFGGYKFITGKEWE